MAGRAVLTALRPASDIQRPGIRMSFRKTAVVGVALVCAAALGGPAFAQEDRGKVLFGLCTQCHGEDGGGDPVALAPGIAGLGEWYILAQLGKFRSGVRGTHFDDIPGMRMRPMSLTLRSEDDVKAVAAYVASLPPPRIEPRVEGGDAERGQTLYATCAACHGAKAEGNQALFAPSLLHTGDWYLLSSLERFKSGARGSNPLDQTGIMMRPMAMILADEQSVKDVAAYVTKLGGSH
jgi:cytochrome c oxidase subunit 2